METWVWGSKFFFFWRGLEVCWGLKECGAVGWIFLLLVGVNFLPHGRGGLTGSLRGVRSCGSSMGSWVVSLRKNHDGKCSCCSLSLSPSDLKFGLHSPGGLLSLTLVDGQNPQAMLSLPTHRAILFDKPDLTHPIISTIEKSSSSHGWFLS
jgi:hypothetical protein